VAYHRPRSLADATAILATSRDAGTVSAVGTDSAAGFVGTSGRSRADKLLVMAGGTDIYPGLVGRSVPGDVLDLSAVSELRGIERHSGELPGGGLRADRLQGDEQRIDQWRIGACTTWNDVITADLPPSLSALQTAARQIGGRQIQMRGTVGGNLCTASPAGDGIAVLVALSAEVELVGPTGNRRLPISEFITGYRATTLADDELVAAIWVPNRSGPSDFQKLGSRSHLVISIVMVATQLEMTADAIVPRIAVGACSPVATRLRGLETELQEWLDTHYDPQVNSPYPSTVQPAEGLDFESFDFESFGFGTCDYPELSPIDDVRGTADYRRGVVAHLVKRSVGNCLEML